MDFRYETKIELPFDYYYGLINEKNEILKAGVNNE